jgi:hypothetical protein
MKTCKICQETLPEDQFHKDRTKPDGYLNRCKPCTRVYMADLKSGIKLTKEERIQRVIDAKSRDMVGETQMTKYILKEIGYDTESELSVHEQFLIKHGLLKSEHQVSC